MDVTDIIAQYSELLDTAQALTDELVVSSVCPRLDTSQNLDRYHSLNAGLQSLSADKDCTFIDHTPTFTLADGTINEGFLLGKGPHLTRAGTNRLAKNLKLPTTGESVASLYSAKASKHQQHKSQHRYLAPEKTVHKRGCYNCGERNHISKNCRHGGPIVCSSCKREGHKAKFCRQR